MALWRPESLAKELALSRGQVYRLVAQRRIPFVKIGASVRFDVAAIERWLAGKQVVTVHAALAEQINEPGRVSRSDVGGSGVSRRPRPGSSPDRSQHGKRKAAR